MAKKVRVHNSPFERDLERLRDVQRWCQQGIMFAMPDGEYSFTTGFADAVRKEMRIARSVDPTYDDGVMRRWTSRESGGVSTQQLLPVKYVGTPSGVTRNPDKLKRRMRRAPVLYLMSSPA